MIYLQYYFSYDPLKHMCLVDRLDRGENGGLPPPPTFLFMTHVIFQFQSHQI